MREPRRGRLGGAPRGARPARAVPRFRIRAPHARRRGALLSISGDPRFGPQGAFVGYRGVGRDVTEIALARERIASLAYSDPLTGLANRASLVPALEQAVQRARRKNSKLAVVFLDLDGFKEINDVTATTPATRC